MKKKKSGAANTKKQPDYGINNGYTTLPEVEIVGKAKNNNDVNIAYVPPKVGVMSDQLRDGVRSTTDAYNDAWGYENATPNMSDFERAFAYARHIGKSRFIWNGKLYNTMYKEEVPRHIDSAGDDINVATDNPELELMKKSEVPEEDTRISRRINRREARILRRSKRRAERHARRASIVKHPDEQEQIPDLTDITNYL